MSSRVPPLIHRQLGEPLATAAIVTLLVLSGATTLANITRLRDDSRSVATAYDVLSAVDSIGHSVEQVAAALLAYEAVRHDSDLTAYQLSILNFERQLLRLNESSEQAPVYRPLVGQLQDQLRQYRESLQLAFDQLQSLPVVAALDPPSSSSSAAVALVPPTATIEPVQQSLSDLQQLAQTSVAVRLAESETNFRTARYTTWVLSAAGLALVAGVMWVVFRRRVQAELDASRLDQELRLRQSTLDAFAKYVLVCDYAQRIVTVNEALLNQFQLRREDVVGKPVGEIAAGQWAAAGLVKFIDEVALDPFSDREIETRQRFGTAGERVLLLRGRPFSTDVYRGGLILVIINDVTQQRDLQQRNEQLNQHIQWFLAQVQDYAIFMMDTEYRATTWNPGVLQVLGYEEQEFLGRDVRPLIFTEESLRGSSVDQEFAAVAQAGSVSLDRWMRRKDGSSFWASGITTAIRDDLNQLVGFSKVMRDMTLQKRNSDEVSRLAAKSMEEVRHKSEFIATLAHEMRSPLAPIKSATQLMALMDLPDELDELRQTIARQSDQLARLVEDLTDVSRLSHGKMEIKREVVELGSLLEAAVEASANLIQENQQTLRWDREAVDTTVCVDPVRITQVVTNLLNNASKYSDSGCVIDLETSVIDDCVRIVVRDNGVGIDPDQLDEIFEIFIQVGDGEERGAPGLGLGLMLVRTIAELHGGKVIASSEGRGQGSEFTVTLPVVHAQDSPPLASTTESIDELPHVPLKILIVDDMRPLATLLARLLNKLNHQTAVVHQGQAALERLRSFPADIVFSDISMPGMTGYELAEALRSDPATQGLTLVAMTGYGQPRDREKALQAGFDEHMVKPVDMKKLRLLLSQLPVSNRSDC